MNTAEAKRILMLHRPGIDEDPEYREALSLVEKDLELGIWYLGHCATQTALRKKFRSIPVPEGLRERILAGQKIVHPPFWRRQGTWLAAAACFLVLAMTVALLKPPRKADRFADFRARVVRGAIREYRMDLESADAAKVREHMRRNGAPSDYTLTAGLEKLALRGGGLLRWRGNPVSMVCFERANREMVFLFVMDVAVLDDAPAEPAWWSPVKDFSTVSWQKNGRVYVLGTTGEQGEVKKLL